MLHKKFSKLFFQGCFCIAVIIFSNCALAQVPTWKWGRGVTAAPGYIPSFGISLDAASNAYVVGSFDGTNCNPYFGGGDTLHGDVSPFIVKYDSQGNTLWAKTVLSLDHVPLTSGGEGYFCDAVDKHGNIYVAGFSYSQTIVVGIDTLQIDGLYTSLPDSNRARIFIVKYDPLGNVIWCKTIMHRPGNPTQLDERGYKIAADVNEGFVLTGYLNCNDPSYYWIFGSDTIRTTSYGNTCLVAKFDSSGNAIWAKPYGGLGVTEDPTGNVFVTADWRSLTPYQIIGPDTLYGRQQILADTGYYVSYIVKLSPSGTIIKAVNCGAIYWMQFADYAWLNRGLATDKTGNVYLSSDYTDSLFIGTDTLINQGDPMSYHSFFLAKYDENLDFKWVRSDSNIAMGYVATVACDTMEGVYVGGFFMHNSEVMPIVKFDTVGNHLWSKSGYPVFCSAMELDNTGNAFTTGLVYDGLPCNFDGDTVTSTSISPYGGLTGYFAAKLGSNAGLGISNISNNIRSALIYPNPTSSNLNLKVDPDLIGENYFVADLVGKTVLTGRISQESTCLEFDGMRPGVYLLRIGDITLKVVKL